jgi:large subunit ribosomal protein L23
MSILKKPVITEKSSFLMEKKVPQYGFEVAMDATKEAIRSEVERIYEVQVADVRTLIVRGKRRSRFTKAGMIHGKSPNRKKAIVTLKKGYEIDFYKHI